MSSFDFAGVREQLIFTRGLTVPGDRTRFYKDVAGGRYLQVVRGAYLRSDAITRMDPADRHLVAVVAASQLREDLVFAHVSAALCWGMPLVGSAPSRPEVIASSDTSERSNVGLIRHQETRIGEVRRIGGIPVTGLAASLAGLARRQPLAVSVPMLDHAMRPRRDGEVWPANERVAPLDLEFLNVSGSHVGARRLADAVALADGRAESPGESWSRVCIHELRFPMPELQREFRDAFGRMFVDFYWPDLRLAGEFDGFGKYVKHDLTGGRPIADVVMEEKRREDRLRRLGLSVVRWEWSDLLDPRLLRRKLESAGLRAGLSAMSR